jgi:hypothetical protein
MTGPNGNADGRDLPDRYQGAGVADGIGPLAERLNELIEYAQARDAHVYTNKEIADRSTALGYPLSQATCRTSASGGYATRAFVTSKGCPWHWRSTSGDFSTITAFQRERNRCFAYRMSLR